MKRYILIICVLFTHSLVAQTTPYEMVERMGRGVNLGNVFSAPVEGNWSPVVFEQYFIDVANEGFTNVRIPIDFLSTNRTTGSTSSYSAAAGTSGSYTGTPADYVLSPTFLDRIEAVVTWGLNAGLVITIDFHGGDLKKYFIKTFDSGESAYTEPTSARRAADNEKFRTVWAAVAERFKNYEDDLIFEIINEPYFHMSEDDMNTLNTDLIPIIRATGANNTTRKIIITGGTNTSHEAPLAISPTILASDNYLIPTFHYYQPFKFTSSTKNANPDTDWGSTADKATLDADFLEVKNWATTNNVPIFVGEFSADNTLGYDYSTGDLKVITGSQNPTGFAKAGPDNASRVEYHRYIAEKAISLGFSFAAWDSGPSSNKAIHMRKDNPISVNYNINNFSVITYDPKSTVVSNVIDNSIWIEDVKEALLADGTWPICYGPTNVPIINPTFECGYNSDWNLNVWGGVAVANYSDSGVDSRTGSVGGRIDVTTADEYNKVLLQSNIYSGDIVDKRIRIRGYAKGSGAGETFKIRLKVVRVSGNNFPVSSAFTLTNTYPDKPFEFEYNIPSDALSIQLQVMCGENTGTYFFDDFDYKFCDITTLTSGTWNNGDPSTIKHLVFNDDFDSAIMGNVDACSCQVNSSKTVTIKSGDYLKVDGNIKVDGTLTIEHEGSLVQVDDNATVTNNGTINVKKTTPVATHDSFSILGSPMSGTTRGGAFSENNVVMNHNTNFFDLDPLVTAVNSGAVHFADKEGDNWDFMDDVDPIDATEGYLVGPTTPSVGSGFYNLNYNQGTLNNGVYTYNAILHIDEDNSANILSNPYASAIDAHQLLTNHNTVFDAIYYWEHITPPGSYPGYRFENWNMGDISLYSLSGGLDAPTAGGGAKPSNQFIPSGQGFGIKAKMSAPITFNNSLRVTGNNMGYRNTETIERLYIKVSNPTYDLQSGSMIAFTEDATNGYESNYDTKRLATPISIYTVLEDRELAIQGRSPFNLDQIIPLGFRTMVEEPQIYTISISSVEGEQITQATVYLKDNLLNTITNLIEGDYTFTSNESNQKDRFVMVFTEEVLGTNDLSLESITVYPNPTQDDIHIVSPLSEITSLTVYDVRGRELQSLKVNNQTSYQLDMSNLETSMYFVKITTQGGSITKRIIKE